VLTNSFNKQYTMYIFFVIQLSIVVYSNHKYDILFISFKFNMYLYCQINVKIFLKELQQNANNNKCAEGSLNLIYFSDEIIYTSSLNYFYKFRIILLIISLIVLLFPHFTTDCESETFECQLFCSR
jgi:hypothetical protein